jgi:hypothetical protein
MSTEGVTRAGTTSATVAGMALVALANTAGIALGVADAAGCIALAAAGIVLTMPITAAGIAVSTRSGSLRIRDGTSALGKRAASSSLVVRNDAPRADAISSA